jgi:hypothetical protein
MSNSRVLAKDQENACVLVNRSVGDRRAMSRRYSAQGSTMKLST